MKARFFLLLVPVAVLACDRASAQEQTLSAPAPAPSTPAPTTNSAPATTAAPAPPKPHVVDVPQPEQPSSPGGQTDQNIDPAKVAEFEQRFAQGKELEQKGKLTDALGVFNGILAEDPAAKGSLREAGIISIELNQLLQADDYFSRLHALVPDYPAAMEYLIQINQALKRDVKVAILRRELHDLRAAGKVPKPYFVRERIDAGQGDQLVMTEFFDYTQDPNTVWMAELFDSAGNIKRRLLLNYDPDATQALRAKDPRLAQAEVFALYEHVFKDGQVHEIDAYKTYIGLPDYAKTRLDMLAILASTPKPIYSAPVPVQ